MSDIPRYRPVSNDRYGITDDADGKLCEYRDYARLKAKVERLTAFTTRTIIPNEELQAENARLKAQVERLKKDVRHQKSMLWALEAYTGKLAVNINPNPWGMRNPHRKNNGCYFDGNPISKEGKQP